MRKKGSTFLLSVLAILQHQSLAKWSIAKAAVRKFPMTPILPDKTASDILDGVAEHKGRIIVPYEPNHLLYGGYILGNGQVEDFLLKHAHDHRILFETQGRFA